MQKKKLLPLMIVIILVISIIVPIILISIFIKEEGGKTYPDHMTYKEFHDKYDSMDLKDGDIVYIEDTFSNIWYNQSAQYTYITFKSMDGNRTAPWGYDAGYPEDITDEFHSGDKVLLKIEMKQELRGQGVPTLVGHIKSIEHLY